MAATLCGSPLYMVSVRSPRHPAQLGVYALLLLLLHVRVRVMHFLFSILSGSGNPDGSAL